MLAHGRYGEGNSWKRDVQQLLLVTSLLLASLGICGAVQAENVTDDGSLGGLVIVLGWLVLLMMVVMSYKLCTCFYFEVILGRPPKRSVARSVSGYDARSWSVDNPLNMTMSESNRRKIVRSLSSKRFKMSVKAESAGPPRRLGAPFQVQRPQLSRLDSITTGTFELTNSTALSGTVKAAKAAKACVGARQPAAVEAAEPDKRVDSDGLWYTKEQFDEFYGEWADQMWADAQPASMAAAATAVVASPPLPDERKVGGRVAALWALLTRGPKSGHRSNPRPPQPKTLLSRMASLKSFLSSLNRDSSSSDGGGHRTIGDVENRVTDTLPSRSLPQDPVSGEARELSDVCMGALHEASDEQSDKACGWSIYDKSVGQASGKGTGWSEPRGGRGKDSILATTSRKHHVSQRL